jgi:hypothetical protein
MTAVVGELGRGSADGDQKLAATRRPISGLKGAAPEAAAVTAATMSASEAFLVR